ncbi:MAG: DUF1289 domain-containing protein [Burkholderiaceae bacterium]
MSRKTDDDASRTMQGVPSPCINVCRMDARTGWCEGCARSIDEIAQWAALDDVAKREVWGRLAQRRELIAAASRGTR